MKPHDPYDEDDMPWDVKTIAIELGNEDDEWIEIDVFHEKSFNISFRNVNFSTDENGIVNAIEDMHISVARKIRDFLNYAVP